MRSDPLFLERNIAPKTGFLAEKEIIQFTPNIFNANTYAVGSCVALPNGICTPYHETYSANRAHRENRPGDPGCVATGYAGHWRRSCKRSQLPPSSVMRPTSVTG